MEDTLNETENSPNPEEEETSEEETSSEEQETSEEPVSTKEEVVAQRDRVYARLKKEEKKNKELEAKLKKSSTSSAPTEDLTELAGKMRALSGLDALESERVIRESKLQGASLSEARKSQDFKFWRSSYRAKLEKDKSPKPSTKQTIGEIKKTYEQMTPAEFEKAAVEGLNIIDTTTGKIRKVNLLDKGLKGRLEEQYRGG